MSSAFKFVIVGSGNISNTYVNSLKNIDDAECVGVVSRSGRKPSSMGDAEVEIASKIGEIKSDFDAVILTTPNGLHHQGAIEAAKLGKHVLTEKVLEVNLDNCDAILDACRENNVRIGVTYQRRMSPDNKIVKSLIDQGGLGRIFAADLEAKFYRDQAYYDSGAYRGTKKIDGGGPFIQQASHNIDLYTWFFGVPAKVASALGTFMHEIESEDHGVAIVKHENGMIGTIIASTCCKPGFSAKITIHSEKGHFVLDNDVIICWDIEGMENPTKSGDVKLHNGAANAAVADTYGHECVIRDFIQAVRENREPSISGAEGRKSVELIQRIYQSGI